MYDWVVRQHCFPVFWGTNLSSLTLEEVDFLKKKQSEIFLVVDGLTELTISRSIGTEDALKAVKSAKALIFDCVLSNG